MLMQHLLQKEMYYQEEKEEGAEELKIINKEDNHLGEWDLDFLIVRRLNQSNKNQKHNNNIKEKDREKIHLEEWDQDF